MYVVVYSPSFLENDGKTYGQCDALGAMINAMINGLYDCRVRIKHPNFLQTTPVIVSVANRMPIWLLSNTQWMVISIGLRFMLCTVDIEVYLKSLAISPTGEMSISRNLLWYCAIAAHKNRRVSPVWVDSSWSRCVINSILFIAGHDILISLHVQPCRAQTRTNGVPGFTDRWRTYWTPHSHSPRHFFANDTSRYDISEFLFHLVNIKRHFLYWVRNSFRAIDWNSLNISPSSPCIYARLYVGRSASSLGDQLTLPAILTPNVSDSSCARSIGPESNHRCYAWTDYTGDICYLSLRVQSQAGATHICLSLSHSYGWTSVLPITAPILPGKDGGQRSQWACSS